MISIAAQISPHYILHPLSEEDRDEIRKLRPNQIVTIKIRGTRRPRSYLQLQWIHTMFAIVAENTEDENWNTPAKVKMQVKVGLRYYDPECVVVCGGAVHFKYRSFGYKDLPHFEANRIFDQALTFMAKFWGVAEEELLSMVKERG